MISIVCLGVGIAVGIYIASQIGDSIEANTQTKNLVENLERFDRKVDQYGGKTKSGGLFPVGPEQGGKRKRTLNELRQTKSRYSNSNKGKKK